LTTRPGHATLVVHPPIDTRGMSPSEARSLADRLRTIVAAGNLGTVPELRKKGDCPPPHRLGGGL
jgi:hypothetical protein